MKYFLAILLPEPIAAEVTALKQEMKTRYNSGQALYAPPHITLHMPFEWNESKESAMFKPFQKKLSGFPNLEIGLNDFDAFPPRVIFINPDPSRKLIELYKKIGEIAREDLRLLNQDRLNKPFHPHVTIAFRDLKRERFEEAWEEFKSRKYHRSFICKSVWLLKKTDTRWIPTAEISFEASA